MNERDFGIITNDDAELAFTTEVPEQNAQNIKTTLDCFLGTPVKTLSYCFNFGSNVIYPSQVASTLGWRDFPPHPEYAEFEKRVRCAKAFLKAGLDPLRVAGEHARRIGLLFFPSLRMNDLHFTYEEGGPDPSYRTSRFWMEHQDLVG